jgi:predicted dehydrogenase
MKKSISRRQFVSTGLVGLSGLALSGLPSFASTPSLSANIRVGLIGAGQRGQGLATVLKDIPGLELAACCDILPANLNAGMKLCAANSKSYTDYHKLLADKTIDAVIIATPLYLHYAMALDAISANKHVYVEKTMTYDIAQAIAIAKKLKAYPKLVFQVGHQYRYYDMYPKVKTLIENGLIGKVTHFESQYNRNSNWRRPVKDPKLEKQINWRMYKEYSGGVLAELSAHQIDVVNWLTNAHPTKVLAMGDVNFWKDGRSTFDNVRAIYEYPGGVKSSVTSILSNEYNGYMMRILGSDGTIEMGRNYAKLFLEQKKKEQVLVDGVTGATKEAIAKGEPVKIYTDTEGIEPTVFALTAFEDCIRNKKKAVSNELTGRDTAIAVHLGNLATESGKTEFWKPEYSKI